MTPTQEILHQLARADGGRLNRLALQSRCRCAVEPPVKPVRVQLSRRKGARMPANTVKVDRSTPWGNPIVVGGAMNVESENGMVTAEITPAIAVELFREYLRGALRSNPKFLDPLRGKNLGCWCALDAPCHADVLLEAANR